MQVPLLWRQLEAQELAAPLNKLAACLLVRTGGSRCSEPLRLVASCKLSLMKHSCFAG